MKKKNIITLSTKLIITLATVKTFNEIDHSFNFLREIKRQKTWM